MELFSPLRENFLYFRKRQPQKHFLYFLKRKLFLHIRKWKPQKMKKKQKNIRKSFLYFGEMKLSCTKLKKLAWPENQKFLILVFKHKYERKKSLILFLIKKQNFLN